VLNDWVGVATDDIGNEDSGNGFGGKVGEGIFNTRGKIDSFAKRG